jgi:predicted secreted hydrolase
MIVRALISVFLCSVCLAGSGAETDAEGWRLAVSGYQITFPRDHLAHYDFRTEWWYFTGNLRGENGRELGYELTFFRYGFRPPRNRVPVSSRFVMDDLKFAHFAVTDISGKKFYSDSRVSRGAYGEAGFGNGKRLAWIDNWELSFGPDFHLRAASANYALDLQLSPVKPAVLQGENGLSQKAAGEGKASYYYSITRLATSGSIRIGNDNYEVTGNSWFDREWATNQLAENQVGWNWFAIQLTDGSDLMLYQMRLKDGGIDLHSCGKWVGADGSIIDLGVNDFELTSTGSWQSPSTTANYPLKWKLRIPKLQLELTISPRVENQELNLSVVYWEGAITLKGERAQKAVDGVGYMELTGYRGTLPGVRDFTTETPRHEDFEMQN